MTYVVYNSKTLKIKGRYKGYRKARHARDEHPYLAIINVTHPGYKDLLKVVEEANENT